MNSAWQIYDELIAAVPEDSVVSGCLAGLNWFLVRSQGIGVAMRPRENEEVIPTPGRLTGMKTRQLASWIKSWNWYEAAFGLAAINSELNAPKTAERDCGRYLNAARNEDVFDSVFDELRGKKVAVIGHFYNMERLAAVCNLSVLERRPKPGDLPDPAAEYILPDQDVVIITATTLINKTLPRLLQLSRKARVILAGPSTPLTPILLNHGVELLGGLIVREEDLLWRIVSEGGRREIFKAGAQMVEVSRTFSREDA